MEQVSLSNQEIKKKRNNRKYDIALLGLVIGLLFPLLAIILLYFFWGDGNLNKYISMFFNFGSPRSLEKSSKVISLSLIANLIPFYFFLNRKNYRSTKGIILATFLICVLILLYKFVWQ